MIEWYLRGSGFIRQIRAISAQYTEIQHYQESKWLLGAYQRFHHSVPKKSLLDSNLLVHPHNRKIKEFISYSHRSVRLSNLFGTSTPGCVLWIATLLIGHKSFRSTVDFGNSYFNEKNRGRLHNHIVCQYTSWASIGVCTQYKLERKPVRIRMNQILAKILSELQANEWGLYLHGCTLRSCLSYHGKTTEGRCIHKDLTRTLWGWIQLKRTYIICKFLVSCSWTNHFEEGGCSSHIHLAIILAKRFNDSLKEFSSIFAKIF